MGFFENQLHNQFKLNQNTSEGASAVLKFLSTMKTLENLNEQIKKSLNLIFNLSEEIQKLENSKFNLESIFKLQNKLKERFQILNELNTKFKYVDSNLIKLEEELGYVPLNKSIDISINNGSIWINENNFCPLTNETHKDPKFVKRL